MNAKMMIINSINLLIEGYDNVKSHLPEEMRKGLEEMERDAVDFARDIAVEVIKSRTSQPSEKSRQGAKKVDITFGKEQE